MADKRIKPKPPSEEIDHLTTKPEVPVKEPLPEEFNDFGVLESALAPSSNKVPIGFDQEEWEKLTEGFASEDQEVEHVLASRGQTGSRQGRPTNSTVPFKGVLSNHARAVQQRDRAAQLDQESKALEKAGAADRSAKAALKRKLEKLEDYCSLSSSVKKQRMEQELENLEDRRFETHKSRDWLEAQLFRVHAKWAKIESAAAIRVHDNSINTITAAQDLNEKGIDIRSDLPLYGRGGAYENPLHGRGGAYENMMRRTYQEGLAKLRHNTFESKEARDDWQGFVKQLSAAELAIATSQDWEPREPASAFEAVEENKSDSGLDDWETSSEKSSNTQSGEEADGEESGVEDLGLQVNGNKSDSGESAVTDFFGFSDSEGSSDSEAGEE